MLDLFHVVITTYFSNIGRQHGQASVDTHIYIYLHYFTERFTVW